MRMLGLLRGGYGAVVLLFPGHVVAAYSGRPARRGDVRVARVLGTRHVAQAVACAGRPTRSVLLLGAEIDLAHAASALLLAALDRPRRRAGLLDALVAAGFAAAGLGWARCAPYHLPYGSGGLAGVRDRVAAVLAPRLVPARVLRPTRSALRRAL